MKTRSFASGLLIFASVFAGPAAAASITNGDSDAHTLQITEDGVRSELAIGAGETVEVCNTGCFLTLPNGDRAVLEGDEVVDIIAGAAVIK